MSGYLWVQLDRKGHIGQRGVPRGTIRDLDERMSGQWAAYYVNYLQRKTTKLQTWQHIAATSQQRIKDRAIQATIQSTLKRIEESRTRVEEINNHLTQALQAEKSGTSAVAFLRIMQNVLSLSELVKTATDEFGKAPELSKATQSSELIKAADQLQNGRQQQSIQLRAEFNGSIDELQKFLGELSSDIQRGGPPSTVRDPLHSSKANFAVNGCDPTPEN